MMIVIVIRSEAYSSRLVDGSLVWSDGDVWTRKQARVAGWRRGEHGDAGMRPISPTLGIFRIRFMHYSNHTPCSSNVVCIVFGCVAIL